MTDALEPIARIRLIRSWPRLLAVPALLVLLAGAMAVAGAIVVGGIPGLLVAVLGLMPMVGAVLLVARGATMRVEVAEASVHVRWLGGARHYALVPGPVTRVRLRGDEASRLRARSAPLGFQLGAATLRDDEPIEVVRLAPTRTAILVPTDRGRLAVAAASEPELLDALTRAAQARERRAADEPEPADAEGEEAGITEGDEGTAEVPEEPPHVLTGIERAMLDERLARELRQRLEAERLEAERREAERIAALVAAERAAEEAAARARAAEEAALRPRTFRERLPSAGLLVLPLVATLGLWGFGLATGRLPDAGSDEGRLTALALVLAGPACSVGAIMARAWWPRLVAAVVMGGLAASVFVGRALLGG